jgi:hypothetical protein
VVWVLAAVQVGCSPEAGHLETRPVEEVRIEVSDQEGVRDGASPMLEDEIGALREVMRRWRALHPGAPLPDIHLTAGLAPLAADAPPGTLVLGVGPATPDAGDDPATGEAPTRRPARAAFILARRLVELAQGPPRFARFGLPGLTVRETVLARSIQEGAADFLAEVVSGEQGRPRLHAWAREREEEIWESFRSQMDGRRFNRWLGGGSEDEDRPGDLGRFVGYRIAESLWIRNGDPQATVQELLLLRDPGALLDRSLYAGAGPASPAPLRGTSLPTWPGFECHEIRAGATFLHQCSTGVGAVPIVLDAGPGEHHRGWQGIAPVLAAKTQVVAFDRPREGLSRSPREEPDPHAAARELAFLLQIVAPPGPYLLVGPREGADLVHAFARLYPWRTANVVVLDGPLPLLDEELRRQAIRRLTTEQARLAAGPGTSQSPAARGEPSGCWRVGSAGPVSALELPDVVRFVHGPGGSGALPHDRLPVVSPRNPGRTEGSWVPLGLGEMEVEFVPGGRPWTGRLRSDPDGRWRGPVAVDGAPTIGLTLSPHPCEIPE